MEALEMKLKFVTDDFNRARSDGTLVQFFNGTDTTSSLADHNAALTQMIADLTSVTVNDVLGSLHDFEEHLRSRVERTILTFNTETIEIGRISGGTGGEGGAGIELGGNSGTGKAPVITIARKIARDPSTPVDSSNIHLSDEFEITSLKLDKYTGDAIVTKSTGVFQTELRSECKASPADLSAPLSYALRLPSLLAAFVKMWSSHLMFQITTLGGGGWIGWWLRVGVGLGVFVVVRGELRFRRSM
ncbi:hypothetical protein B0H14DRAFT_2659152 [Mycena olivaceomarginata]|nr:hypothetical protein B0H14DRAFT_2659152 [Mycena olivaceomarginata]